MRHVVGKQTDMLNQRKMSERVKTAAVEQSNKPRQVNTSEKWNKLIEQHKILEKEEL